MAKKKSSKTYSFPAPIITANFQEDPNHLFSESDIQRAANAMTENLIKQMSIPPEVLNGSTASGLGSGLADLHRASLSNALATPMKPFMREDLARMAARTERQASETMINGSWTTNPNGQSILDAMRYTAATLQRNSIGVDVASGRDETVVSVHEMRPSFPCTRGDLG